MIHYENDENWVYFLRRYQGSVAPRVVPLAVVVGLFGVFIKEYVGQNKWLDDDRFGRRFEHPFAIEAMALLLGYVLVLRTNIAVNRYMEAIQNLTEMTSKWVHCYEFMLAFDRASEQQNGRHEEHQEFRLRMLHYFSLLSALALSTVSEGDPCSTDPRKFFVAQDPEKGHPHSAQANTGRIDRALDRTSIKKGKRVEVYTLNEFCVLGELTKEESIELKATSDKMSLVSMWINESVWRSQRSKLCCVPPPIVSRVFQEMSNGMLAYNQSMKLVMVQFPFPFAQMIALLMTVFCCFGPFTVAHLSEGSWSMMEPNGSWSVSLIVCFVLAWGYFGVNEIAKEIEEPFGDDPNDLPLAEMQMHFVETIHQVYQACIEPLPDVFENPQKQERGLVPAPRDENFDAEGIKEAKRGDMLADGVADGAAVDKPKQYPTGEQISDEARRLGFSPFPVCFSRDDYLAYPMAAYEAKSNADVARYFCSWMRAPLS